MNITNQLQQVGVFLAEDRLESVLEQVAASAMPFVEINGMSGQQFLHDSGNGDLCSSQHEVKVVRHERPGVTGRFGPGKYGAEPIEKQVPICMIQKDGLLVQASGDDMMKCARVVNSGSARHESTFVRY